MIKDKIKAAAIGVFLLTTSAYALQTIDLGRGPLDKTPIKISLNNGKLESGKVYEVSCWFNDAFPYQLYAQLENAKAPYGGYDLELESGYYAHGTADTNPFPFFLGTRGELNISKVTTENKSLTISTASEASGNAMYYCFAIDQSSFGK